MEIHGPMILIGVSSMQTLCIEEKGGGERERDHVTEEAVGSKAQDWKGIHHIPHFSPHSVSQKELRRTDMVPLSFQRVLAVWCPSGPRR